MNRPIVFAVSLIILLFLVTLDPKTVEHMIIQTILIVLTFLAMSKSYKAFFKWTGC